MYAEFEVLIILLIIMFYQLYSEFVRDARPSLGGKIQSKKPKESPVITPEMIEEALANRTYGEFTMTPAVVFFKDGDVIPSEGYKIEKQVIADGRTRSRITISASAEKILDLFDDLVKRLGDTCGIAVEDFRAKQGHVDHYAYSRDTFIIRSILVDFEDFILNDGFIGIAIWNDYEQAEVQLTVHKIIMVYGFDICRFISVLDSYGLQEDPELRFLFEDFHLLLGTDSGDTAIEALKSRLCVDNSIMQAGDQNLIMN